MMTTPKIPVLVICGPTASGKTNLAVELATRFPIEVVSADSRQIYRKMDIGTAKATAAEQAQVRHHMIDVRDPDEDYSVADYVTEAREAIQQIWQREHYPVIVGGTGLYIRGVLGGIAPAPAADDALRAQLNDEERVCPGTLYQRLQEVDPEQAQRIHPNNKVRIVRALEVYLLSGQCLSELQRQHAFADTPYRTKILGADPGFNVLEDRIRQRAQWMLKAGLIEETQWLAARYPADGTALQTLGYREALSYVNQEMTLQQTENEIALHTRQYAKRQRTWFKKEPGIYWLASSDMSGNIQKLIENFYDN